MARQLAEGRLAQPFGITVPAGRYYVAWPSDRAVSPAMARFTQWLAGAASGPE
ncbi:hypothetical protein [Allosediminivita pacifica]|uniref:hypothetical protein n=1 Tax=Allosediminivita pacifica TaxID=1267769 RepID=UPI00130493A7|nr:hypothetical protein [Allosediminivita pacifica]GGA97608.1 hypothetical protein GCM10011324_04820 [Allosediminivita pacifica]